MHLTIPMFLPLAEIDGVKLAIGVIVAVMWIVAQITSSVAASKKKQGLQHRRMHDQAPGLPPQVVHARGAGIDPGFTGPQPTDRSPTRPRPTAAGRGPAPQPLRHAMPQAARPQSPQPLRQPVPQQMRQNMPPTQMRQPAARTKTHSPLAVSEPRHQVPRRGVRQSVPGRTPAQRQAAAPVAKRATADINATEIGAADQRSSKSGGSAARVRALLSSARVGDVFLAAELLRPPVALRSA